MILTNRILFENSEQEEQNIQQIDTQNTRQNNDEENTTEVKKKTKRIKKILDLLKTAGIKSLNVTQKVGSSIENIGRSFDNFGTRLIKTGNSIADYTIGKGVPVDKLLLPKSVKRELKDLGITYIPKPAHAIIALGKTLGAPGQALNKIADVIEGRKKKTLKQIIKGENNSIFKRIRRGIAKPLRLYGDMINSFGKGVEGIGHLGKSAGLFGKYVIRPTGYTGKLVGKPLILLGKTIKHTPKVAQLPVKVLKKLKTKKNLKREVK